MKVLGPESGFAQVGCSTLKPFVTALGKRRKCGG